MENSNTHLNSLRSLFNQYITNQDDLDLLMSLFSEKEISVNGEIVPTRWYLKNAANGSLYYNNMQFVYFPSAADTEKYALMMEKAKIPPKVRQFLMQLGWGTIRYILTVITNAKLIQSQLFTIPDVEWREPGLTRYSMEIQTWWEVETKFDEIFRDETFNFDLVKSFPPPFDFHSVFPFADSIIKFLTPKASRWRSFLNHGFWTKAKVYPKLQMDRLKKIAQRLQIPLGQRKAYLESISTSTKEERNDKYNRNAY